MNTESSYEVESLSVSPVHDKFKSLFDFFLASRKWAMTIRVYVNIFRIRHHADKNLRYSSCKMAKLAHKIPCMIKHAITLYMINHNFFLNSLPFFLRHEGITVVALLYKFSLSCQSMYWNFCEQVVSLLDLTPLTLPLILLFGESNIIAICSTVII